MRFYKVLSMAVLTAISLSFTSCDDDDDGGKYNPKFKVKPYEISMSNNEGNVYENTSFQYDDIDTTRINSFESKEYYYDNQPYSAERVFKKNKRSNKSIVDTDHVMYHYKHDIIYNSAGQIVELRSYDARIQYTYVYTYEYSSSPTPKASSPKYTYITKKNKDEGSVVAVYKVDSKGRLIQEINESDDPEYTYDYEYTYSENNLTKIQEKDDDDVVEYEMACTYNKNNGIFRNVTTPQWFLMSELFRYASGQMQNNVSKYTDTYIYYDEDKKMRQYLETTTFNYLSFVQNFPSKYEIEYNDNESVYKRTCQVKYNFAK